MTRVLGTAVPRRLGLLALALLPWVAVCTDGVSPPDGESGRSAQFALSPTVSAGLSAVGSMPINRIRISAFLDPGGQSLGVSVQDVDPNLDSWSLEFEVPVPENVSNPTFYVILELINVTDGVETVEWSGRSATIPLDLNRVPEIREVPVVRGPPGNIGVTNVTISDHAATLMEGDSLPLTAVVTGAETPIVYWTSETPTLAVVSASGVVRGTLPGQALIVATAGAKADTTTLQILPRPAAVEITPDSAHFKSIDEEIQFSGTVVDARGDPVPGPAVSWEVADQGVVQDMGAGRFKAVAAGTTRLIATANTTPVVTGEAILVVKPLATHVQIEPAEAYLAGEGEQASLTASGEDATGHPVNDATYEWSSLDPAVATVDGSGLVTAVGDGFVGIVASSGAGADTATITVGADLASVVVSPATHALTEFGQTLQLTGTALDADGDTIKSITLFSWTSDEPDIVSVDETGLATAVGDGVAVITAGIGDVSGTAEVTVGRIVASVTVTPAADTLTALGATTQLTAEAKDALDVPVPTTVTWTSSDTTIVAVDAAGLARATGDGSAVITASVDGVQGQATVLVARVAGSIDVTPTSHGFKFQGETQALSAEALDAGGAPIPSITDFAWTSSNTAVATVDGAGLVTAVGNGTANISASAGGATGMSAITVGIEITDIVVTPATHTFVSEGETRALTAVARDAGGSVIAAVTDFAWRSLNTGVVTVDATGVVTAVADGTATVTASSGGITGSATMTVSRQVGGVAVTPDPPATMVFFGQKQQLYADAVDALDNPMLVSFAWSSLDTPVATVDATGLVTAVTNGTARIVASSGGFADTVTVTVNQGVSYITVAPRSRTFVALGETQTFDATAYDAGGNVVAAITSFTWATSSGAVATVGDVNALSTLVTAVADGTVTVTADAGGAQGTATVKVSSTPASITVAPRVPPAIEHIGGTLPLTATVRDVLGNVVSALVTWTPLDAGIATVASDGTVTAAANGTTSVVATTGALADTVEVTVAQAVAYIDVVPGSKGFTATGDTLPLAASAFDAGGTPVSPTPTFTWSSTNTAVATVNSATGLVTSVGDGSATIKANADGVDGTASITVGVAVASIDVSPDTATLVSRGQTRTYTAVARDALGNAIPSVTAFTWTTSAGGVATVDTGGVVTAVADGSATITAAAGGKQGTGSVTVARKVKTVTVAPATPPTLTSLGQETKLSATVADGLGESMSTTVTWASLSGSIATVDTAGRVTSAANGSAMITATAGGVSDTVTVTVAQAVSTIDVTPGSRGFTSGGETQSFTAVAKDALGNAVAPAPVFTWTSSDTLVATVDAAGLATAVANGSATVKAAAGGVEGTATVTVGLAVVSVEVTPDTATLVSKGETRQYTAVARDGGGGVIGSVTSFTWSTSNGGHATVGADGLVTAVADGSATITAAAGGVDGTASVTVARAVDAVNVTPATPPTLTELGATTQLTAGVTDALGQPMAAVVTWASLNGGIASVDTNGLVTAVSEGTAKVTATASGKADTVDVPVAQSVSSVEVSPSSRSFTSAGDTATLAAVARDAGGSVIASVSSFAWSSSDTTVAKVNPATGLVTSVADGSATITAKAGAVDGTASVSVDQSVGSVTIIPGAPAPLSYLGQTVQLTTDVRDAGNEPFSTTVTWTSVSPTVATVDANGLVTAGNNGTAFIVASATGVADTVTVTVNQTVSSVVVSPASVSMDVGAAALQLSATAKDAGGSTVGGAAFTWLSNNTAVATVSSTGLLAPAADGSTTVDATASGVSGSTAVTITSGSVTRTFTGGSSSDLFDPANWEPAGLPGSTDTLVIEADAEITGEFTIGTLILADGASLTLTDSATLTVTGSLSGTIEGDGTVEMSGDGTISGTVPNLVVSGTATVDGSVTVNGDLETVAGSTLTMTDPDATLDINGDLRLGGDTDGTLTDGVIYLSGELVSIKNSFKVFNADGDNTVVFNGTAQQSVQLEFPGERQNRFQNVIVDNPNGVVFKSDIPILGDATIKQGYIESDPLESTLVWMYGSITDQVGGGWRPDSTIVLGASPTLPDSVVTHVRFGTATTLQSNTIVNGNVTLSGSASQLKLNGHDLTVLGTLVVEDFALLTMDNAADDLTVKGSASFGGGITSSTLTAGRARFEGDMGWATNKVDQYAPSGTESIFSGSAAQQITTAGGVKVYAFDDLRIAAGANVTMTDNITVQGDMVIEAGATFTVPAGKTLTIVGTLTNSGTLTNNGTVVGG